MTDQDKELIQTLYKYGGHYSAVDRIEQLAATCEELVKERDEALAKLDRAVERPNRETFDAMCAMRNAINEYVPMPSIESDLLQGPENSVFCATVAEAVIVEIRRLLDLQANSKAPPMTIRESALQARSEELVKERGELRACVGQVMLARDEYKEAAKVWQEDFIQENQRLYVATVKLAIAVEALQAAKIYIADLQSHEGAEGFSSSTNQAADKYFATLAELGVE